MKRRTIVRRRRRLLGFVAAAVLSEHRALGFSVAPLTRTVPASLVHGESPSATTLSLDSQPSTLHVRLASTARRAALIQNDGSSPASRNNRPPSLRRSGTSTNENHSEQYGRQRRWPRRIWSKLSLSARHRRRLGETSKLHMQVLMTEQEEDTDEQSAPAEATAVSSQPTSGSPQYDNVDFIVSNFNTLDPQTELPGVTPEDIVDTSEAYVDSEFFDVAIHGAEGHNADVELAHMVHGPKERRGISLGSGMALLTENALSNIITRLTVEEPTGLSISAKPRRERFVTQLIRGHLSTDVELNFGRVVFPCLQLSSGSMHIERLTVNLLNSAGYTNGPRFPNPFDFHFDDVLFSKDDLWNSSCFRDGLRLLLVRLLRDRGVRSSSIKVTAVGVLPNGKLFCQGEAKLIGPSLPFEVRTGVSTGCNGHVVKFPGLEISLNRDLGFFMPIVPPIDVDIGHNARIRRIEVDGDKKQVKLSASVTITPANTIQLPGYTQSNKAFGARFSIDAGRWLTNIGNWTGTPA